MNNTYYINKLHIYNFKSFHNIQEKDSSYVTIDFCNHEEAIYKSIILTGPNGYGKTSIFEAIAFALTGQLELSVYADRNRTFIEHVIINDLNKEAFVAVEFVDMDNRIKTILRYAKRGKADSGKDLREEAKDFNAYILQGKFDLEEFKNGDFQKATTKEIAAEFGEKSMQEWLRKNYIQQEYGSNFIFLKDAERVNFLNQFIDTECASYFYTIEEEKKNLEKQIKDKKEIIKQLYEDTKGEQQDIVGVMPKCGKVLENTEILWDKEKYNNKEPFEQYISKAKSMREFLNHIDVYQMKKSWEIAEELKGDSSLIKKVILSKFESNILQEYKKVYEKKKYMTELVQSEDSLLTKNLDERYLSEQQKKEIVALREKQESYIQKANERERIYLQIDNARRELIGKEKLVEDIFHNVCPTCGHDYKQDNDHQTLSDAIIQYQISFDAMQGVLNSTLDNVHKDIKNEIIHIQNQLRDIAKQLDFNLEIYELILEYEGNLSIYHQFYKKYIMMCELKPNIPELSEAKVLLEDKEFYADIANINQIEKKSRLIIERLEIIVKKAEQFFMDCKNFDEIIYSENARCLMELKDKNSPEICMKLDTKIEQLEWLLANQKSKALSEKLKELKKNINQIREWYVRLEKLNKLIKCKTDSQKEYKNKISKLIEIPLYIYSGKLIQTHQNGLGVFCYTGPDEEQLTQFKLCNAGVRIKMRQDITTRFSAGQKAVVNIALMLALRKISNSDIDIFFIDDPCQSMDDLNIASLVEILKNEFPKTQVVVSSHEDDIAAYMYYKYSKVGRKTRLYNVQKEMYL